VAVAITGAAPLGHRPGVGSFERSDEGVEVFVVSGELDDLVQGLLDAYRACETRHLVIVGEAPAESVPRPTQVEGSVAASYASKTATMSG
jgi:hypothetical protein